MTLFLHAGLGDVTAENDVIFCFDASCRWRCRNSSKTRRNYFIALLQGKSVNVGMPRKALLSSSVCESRRWDMPAALRTVMMQIHLYLNQWVVKLKQGCRGEEAIWKIKCPFNAQWRPFYVTVQTVMHLQKSLELFFSSLLLQDHSQDRVLFAWLTQLNLSSLP